MRLDRVEVRREAVPLTRPYTIASRHVDAVDLFFVRLVSDGRETGLGSASPAPGVTGESVESCALALGDAEALLRGRDPRHLGALATAVAEAFPAAPAARAALDMALWDLVAKRLDVPLVDLLGLRRPEPLPTSITIGIKPLDATLDEAAEYVGRGFRRLKVKIGLDLDGDLERLRRLRQAVPPEVAIRVDANQGYTAVETIRFAAETVGLGLELIEQPLPAADVEGLRALPDDLRPALAADEALLREADALRLLRPKAAVGSFVLKLMKHGGVSPARRLADLAATAGIGLMWGCMDESALSIAAALHAAYASPATRFLDLDGAFDLAQDPARGGYRVVDGRLVLAEGPGLGVELDER